MVPVLNTARLILDAHTANDLDRCAAMWSDPAVIAHVGGRPFSREESWHRIQRHLGHWTLHPYGYWAIRDAGTGRYIGSAGLANSRRDTVPSFEGTPEAGWALAAEAQGQGYAAEAMRAILRWADASGLARTVCIIDPGNARSVRLAESLGYERLCLAQYRGGDVLLFDRRRSHRGSAADVPVPG